MHEAEAALRASRLGLLLDDSNITDITYNGDKIFYVSSLEGRKYYQQWCKKEALNLIRQIANMTNQLFTYQNPILDVVFSCYRLSAIHPLIGRDTNDNAVSFALRIASTNKDLLVETQTVTDKITSILSHLLKTKRSIVISGQTGVGKTELQKYMLGLLADHTRVVVIDQGVELATTKLIYPFLDLTFWRYENKLNDSSLTNLIKTSLRFNPDYVVIAEARGEEIIDIYNATLSGHPSVFTIHSENETLIYERMLAMTSYKVPLKHEDLIRVFPYIIHLTKDKRGNKIIRKIKCIVTYEQDSHKATYLYNDET